jgi:acyl carrier protein
VADELPQKVMALVADELRVKRERLSLETRLLHDLGCDGNDAVELINRFVRQFQVEASTFDFRPHFGPEASFNPLTYVYWRVFKPARLRFVPLTLGDLVDAVRSKRLRNPDRAAV